MLGTVPRSMSSKTTGSDFADIAWCSRCQANQPCRRVGKTLLYGVCGTALEFKPSRSAPSLPQRILDLLRKKSSAA